MIRPEGAATSVLNQMIQLQELIMGRAEQEAARPQSRQSKLKETIDTLSAQLPEEVRSSFHRLMSRDGVAIVPMNNSSCSACAINLPVGLANQIKLADQVISCPACARFLYFSSATPRGVRRKAAPGKPITGVARFTSPELMLPQLTEETTEALFSRICHTMAAHGFVEEPESLIQAALQREELLSTSVGNMIAFPHVRGVEGGGLSMALATHKKGLDFGDKTRTRVFFFMAIPSVASAFYVRLLSGLSQAFHEAESRDLLLEAETPTDLWNVLLKQTRKTIK